MCLLGPGSSVLGCLWALEEKQHLLFSISSWARTQIGSDLCVFARAPNTNCWEMASSGKCYGWPEAPDREVLVLSSQSAPDLGSNWGGTPKTSLHPVFGGWHSWGPLQLSGTRSTRVSVPWPDWGGQGPVGSAWITPP